MTDSLNLVPLRNLEEELGLQRSELLLLLRKYNIETVHKGLRTYVRRDSAIAIKADSTSEAVSTDKINSALTVLNVEPTSNDGPPGLSEAAQFAQLRLLRERLDLLLLCADRGVCLESGELAALLGLRRVAARQQDTYGVYFDRYGMRFRRQPKPGHRTGWQIFLISDKQGG
jgi:hypothetical protein